MIIKTNRIALILVALLAVGIFALVGGVADAMPAGTPAGYQYYKTITVGGSSDGTLTNYDLPLNIYSGTGSDTAGNYYLNNHMQSNYGDLMFVDASGNTLYYTVMSGGPGYSGAGIDVKLLSLPSAGTTIYMFYGKGGVSYPNAYNNGYSTFALYDTFPGSSINASIWSTSGTVSVSGGVCTLTNSGALTSSAQFGQHYAAYITVAKSPFDNNSVGLVGFNGLNSQYAAIDVDWYATTVGNNYNGGYTQVTLAAAGTGYHEYMINRISASAVYYQEDGGAVYSDTGNVPTSNEYIRAATSSTYTMSLTRVYVRPSTPNEPSGFGADTGELVIPQASFGISGTMGATPYTVTVTDTSSPAPASWTWNWGDGTANNTTQNAVHTYTTAGTFTVTLTATNTGGNNSTTQTVTITQGPVPGFYSPAPVTMNGAPATITFTDTSTGYPTSYTWNFGDGQTSNNVGSVTHTYTSTGQYTVSLTETNANATNSITRLNYVNINTGSLPGYTYTFNHTINGSTTALSYYVMEFNVYNTTGTNANNTIFLGNHVQSTFADLRITDKNNTVLPYWIGPTMGANNVSVYVNVTYIPAGVNSTYLRFYYGNSAAVSASNGMAVFPFFDNFTIGSGGLNSWWTATGNGVLNWGNMILQGSGDAVLYSNSAYNLPLGYKWASVWSTTTGLQAAAPATPKFSANATGGSAWEYNGTGLVYNPGAGDKYVGGYESLTSSTTYTSYLWYNGTTANYQRSDDSIIRCSPDTYNGATRYYAEAPNGAQNLVLYDVYAMPYAAVQPNDSNYTSEITMLLPTAAFTSTQPSGTAPLMVAFNDTSSNEGNISLCTFLWNFGDGGTSTQRNATWNYTYPASFTVTFTVTNQNGSNTITRAGYVTTYSSGGNILPVTFVFSTNFGLGGPCSYATVNAYQSGSFINSAVTDSSGTCTIYLQNVPPYTINIQKSSWNINYTISLNTYTSPVYVSIPISLGNVWNPGGLWNYTQQNPNGGGTGQPTVDIIVSCGYNIVNGQGVINCSYSDATMTTVWVNYTLLKKTNIGNQYVQSYNVTGNTNNVQFVIPHDPHGESYFVSVHYYTLDYGSDAPRIIPIDWPNTMTVIGGIAHAIISPTDQLYGWMAVIGIVALFLGATKAGTGLGGGVVAGGIGLFVGQDVLMWVQTLPGWNTTFGDAMVFVSIAIGLIYYVSRSG